MSFPIHLRESLSAHVPGADFTPYFAFMDSLLPAAKGHKHHILPRKEFPQHVKTAENIIRVSPTDHFKAHYYLALCAPECESFQVAFYLMANRKRAYQIDRDDLPRYIETYEQGRILQANAARERGLKYVESGHTARMIASRHATPESDETRKRMSDAHRGKKNHNYGKKFSIETCTKLSNVRRGKMVGTDNPMFGKKRPDLAQWNKDNLKGQIVGEKNPMFGKERPDLAQWNRENLKGKKRKPFSKEHKKRISKAKLQYWAKRRNHA